MAKELISADPLRCQVDKPNGEGPFTLGGGHKMVRCTNVPTHIATETQPDELDGLCGSMSMCEECKAAFLLLFPADFATFEEINKG